MGKYVSKPVEIEAVQINGISSTYGIASVGGEIWLSVAMANGTIRIVYDDVQDETVIEIKNNGDVLTVREGDWIIYLSADDIYPCSDEVFQKKYMRDEQQSVTFLSFINDIGIEVRNARKLFPYEDNPMIAALAEETGELSQSMLHIREGKAKASWEHVRKEAIQVAAMAFRCWSEGDDTLGLKSPHNKQGTK